MKKTIGKYQIQLNGDLIRVSIASTGECIKAFEVRPNDAVDKFNEICRKAKAAQE
jgi:hypothetical protein